MNTEQLIFDKGNETASGFVGYGPNGESYLSHGLTKREYFAAIAMQGFLAACDGWVSPSDLEEVGKRSVLAADALIERLNS